MRSPLRYLKNICTVALMKARYGNKLKMGAIQTFEKLRLEISGKGKVIIGSYNQNREKLYLSACGGVLTLGSHCFFNINGSVTCLQEITIGDNCKFGNNVVIVDHDHNFRTNTYDNENPEFISSPIRIGNNVWCGANVTILRGSEIGDNCVIAAGATVKGKYKASSIIVPNCKNAVKCVGGGMKCPK